MLEVSRRSTLSQGVLGCDGRRTELKEPTSSALASDNFMSDRQTMINFGRLLDNLHALNQLKQVESCYSDGSFMTAAACSRSGLGNLPLCGNSQFESLFRDKDTFTSESVLHQLRSGWKKHNPELNSEASNQSKTRSSLKSKTIPPGRVSSSNCTTSCAKLSNTSYQFHLHRQQRSRKFRLNLFMYSALYRKQRIADENYTIYHNPIEDPDATYTSYSNPNYFFNRAQHQFHSSNNNYDPSQDGDVADNSAPMSGHNSISLEKLSLTSDFFSPRKGSWSFSSYSSSCETTPTTPDRSFVLQKLHSPSDDDDGDVEVVSDGEEVAGERPSSKEQQCGQENVGGKFRDEQRVFYGIGTTQCRRSRSIMGYLESLERQALEREMGLLSGGFAVDPDEEREMRKGGDEEEDDTIKTLQDGDQPVEPSRNEKFDYGTEINSPDSNDSGIQTGDKTPFLFSPATPGALVPEAIGETESVPEKEEVLPEGWQKHEDDDGPYFWHVKSGTIQRDPPPPAPPDGPALCSPKALSLTSDTNSRSNPGSKPGTPGSLTAGGTDRHLAEFEGHALQYAARSLQTLSAFGDRVAVPFTNSSLDKQTVRFAVRSLGWVKIAEEDLTPERSSRAVNKCIMDLSLGRNNVNDAVGRWGDGKDLFMDLDQASLRLVDPVDGVTLNTQPVHAIRVWGVGRDNGRDFAYVARDRGTRTYMCHVFHCETPAVEIANTLRDICKKIMLERSMHQSAVARLTRPTDLPHLDRIGQPKGQKLSFRKHYNNAKFPTPMEEPRKIMRCHYLGCQEVVRPTGRDILNEAIQKMYYSTPPEKWKFVSVGIAPSTITVTEHGNPDGIIEEFRVRFLSFLGIAGDNVRLCAFIMHTSQNRFVCHVFHCDPSAGPMCKTIEAACKLRYQKCLDAHPQNSKNAKNGKSLKKSIKQSIQCVWGSVTSLASPK